MTTPTFLRIYLRRCEPQDFASLDVVFGAAEKVPAELFESFEAKFGVRPLEAYGCTELSPLVAVNVPASRLPQAGSPGDLRSGAWHGQETGQKHGDAQETSRDMPTGRNGVGRGREALGGPSPE